MECFQFAHVLHTLHGRPLLLFNIHMNNQIILFSASDFASKRDGHTIKLYQSDVAASKENYENSSSSKPALASTLNKLIEFEKLPSFPPFNDDKKNHFRCGCHI